MVHDGHGRRHSFRYVRMPRAICLHHHLENTLELEQLRIQIEYNRGLYP